MDLHIESTHPKLAYLVRKCLHNAPSQRPTTEKLLLCIQNIRVEVENKSGCISKLDNILGRVRLDQELKEKERRIEELQVSSIFMHKTQF